MIEIRWQWIALMGGVLILLAVADACSDVLQLLLCGCPFAPLTGLTPMMMAIGGVMLMAAAYIDGRKK